MHGEASPLEEHHQLGHGNGRSLGLSRELEHCPQPPTFKAATDQIQADSVPRQGTKLRSVPLQENDAVPLIRIESKFVGLGQQTVEALPKVASVLNNHQQIPAAC